MMEFLQFMFSSGWKFAGCALIIYLMLETIVNVSENISYWFKKRKE